MKSQQIESQNLVFPPGTWIQKYATTKQIVKTCALSPPWSRGNFSAPVALHGRGLRTCWRSAAPSPRPCRCCAESWTPTSGAWAPSTARRSSRWTTWRRCWKTWGSLARRRWCAVLQSPWRVDGVAFCVGKSWEKLQGNNNHIFRSSQNFVSAMLHEQVNFTQIISNHLKSRHVWTCQNMDMSKFSKRFLQRTDAALQVSVWDVWGCQSVFAKKHRTDAPCMRLEFICKRKIGTTMTHIQIMLKCQLVELCVLFFKFWIMCTFTWYNCTWHLFHQSKLKAVAHLSSLSTWYSQADPGLGPHTTGAIPRRQAEALHRRALAGREAHLGANHPHTLTSMNNLANLLGQQGKLAEAELRVFGVRGDFPGGRLAKAWGLRPGFVLFNFPVLLGHLFWAN